ncbi:MAG TPA: DUF4215 domain-containing protein [Polyangiaceae bacterium]|nr:DUF4215 domain-containing protein [Polyangiaceae bacterium]
MKRIIAVASFVALSVGAATAGAQVIKGSDTLNKLTDDIVAQCPGATGIDYQGGGSTGGENLIANGTQQVAPMSRFIQPTAATVCNFPNTSTAEGINVATDKLAVLSSALHKDSCDPGADVACATTGGFNVGTCASVGGAWKHALRLIYFGLNCNDGQNPNLITGVRNCLDPDRVTLINTWGNMFQSPSASCSGGGAGGTLPAGNCVQLRHAFRRDEQSGTTDAFRELVAANTSARTGTNGYPFCNEYPAAETQNPVVGGACSGASQTAANAACPLNTTCNCGGVFPCTATCVAPTLATCGDGALAATEECDDGNTANFDGCSSVCLKEPGATPACSGELTSDVAAGSPGLPTQIYIDAYQDADPVRRTCSGTFNVGLGTSNIDTKMAEEVCGRDGTLGLLQAISVPQALDGVAAADLGNNAYPKTNCRQGRFVNGGAPVVKSGIGAARRFALCPDGRTPRNTWWDTAERLARPGRCSAGACTSDAQCGLGGGSCVNNVCVAGNCSAGSQCGTSGGACAVSAAATCPVPATDTNDARCINAKNNKPSITAAAFPTPGCVVPAANIDGRAFNLTLRTASGGLHKTSYNGNREVIGAVWRLHTSRTLLGQGVADNAGTNGACDDGVCCDQVDSTRQIGCLVAASSCSNGFAGIDATIPAIDPAGTPAGGNDTFAHGNSLNLNSSSNTLNCSGYPMTRPLFLNTLKGFETVTGTELGLAKCYSGIGLNSPHSITSMILASEFIPKTTGPTCQDFPEASEVTCGDGPNDDACANNPAGIACQDNDDCGGALTCVFTPEPGGLTKGNCQ